MSDQPEDNQFEAPPEEEPQPPQHPAPEAAPPGPDPGEQIRVLKEKASKAFQSGSNDAREAFDRSFPHAKEEFSKGINDVSYALGYAVSFGTTLINEMTPENVTEGFERGTRAGSKAAEEVVKHRKAQSPDVPEDPGPATT